MSMTLLRQALARVSVKDAVGEVALATGRRAARSISARSTLTKDGGDGAAR